MADDEASSKKVVLKIFGQELGEKLALAAGYGKRKDYRKVLEPTDAVTQCERSGNPFKPGMPCYLCGLPIPDKKLLKGSDDELYVECEHIFPVTEARWFLDLYMTTRPPDDTWTRTAIQLEYAQSHRVCNQAKSNLSFIKEDPATGMPLVNRVGIQRVLKNIQIRARQHIGEYKNRQLDDLMKDIANTILSRSSAVEQRVQIIIDHIQTNENFINTDLVLLMRTSLLADPNTMTPALKDIYNQWYANTEDVRGYKDRLFQTFLEETYSAYPQLRPENITTTLSIPSEYQSGVTSDLVRDTLRIYFETKKTPDRFGKTLLSAVYYRIYSLILGELMNKVTDTNVSYFCNLYRRMNTIQKNEPIVATMFGPVPVLSKPLQSRCEMEIGNLERQERTRARELTDEDVVGELPTPEEEATYFLNEFQSGLQKLLTDEGKPPDEAKSISEAIETTGREAFLEAYPEGIDRAIESAALQIDVLLRLTLNDKPEFADKIATLAYNYVLSNRRGETRTYGGGRRPLYSNVRGRRQKKRLRTYRARRLSRKSKTRRNRI
jgi:hypothetical protein